MEDKIHPVVQLLAARKDAFPEEFEFIATGVGNIQVKGRWDREIEQLGWYMTEAEKTLLYRERREKVFDTMYHIVLERLLTGERV